MRGHKGPVNLSNFERAMAEKLAENQANNGADPFEPGAFRTTVENAMATLREIDAALDVDEVQVMLDAVRTLKWLGSRMEWSLMVEVAKRKEGR